MLRFNGPTQRGTGAAKRINQTCLALSTLNVLVTIFMSLESSGGRGVGSALPFLLPHKSLTRREWQRFALRP